MKGERQIWKVITGVPAERPRLQLGREQWEWREVVRCQVCFSDKLNVVCETKRGWGSRTFSLSI